MMEHRCTERVPLETDLFLYQRETPVTICRTSDISPEGIFVRLEQGDVHAPLRNATYLEIGLTLEQQGLLQRHRIPVLVAHRQEEGVGLMFIKNDPVVSDAIRKLIAERGEWRGSPREITPHSLRVSEGTYAR